MHVHNKHIILISEQQVTDTNLLFDLAHILCDLQHPSQHSTFLYAVITQYPPAQRATHTHNMVSPTSKFIFDPYPSVRFSFFYHLLLAYILLYLYL